MKNLLLLVLFALSYGVSGQSILLGKVVTDAGNGLDFANILLLNARDSSLVRGDLTMDNGSYSFDQVAAGDYILYANMIGYTAVYSKVVNVGNEAEVVVEQIVLSEGVAMQEVTITAQKPMIEMKADKMIVNVENSIVNAGNSALEVLQKSPGIIVDNNNRVSLRGREGVLITINGKKQYMSSDEVARMLQNMPASSIKSIEIISNPSAKYDAEGNGGIINIVLKKNENIGYNGQFGATGRKGLAASYFTDLNLNYRTEKLNIYGGGEYYNWGRKQNVGLMRNVPSANGLTSFDQLSKMDIGGLGYYAKIGLDYNLTSKTTLGFLAKINDTEESFKNDNNTYITGVNGPDYYRLFVDTDGSERYKQKSGNINLKHDFDEKGMSIVFDADYSLYRNNGDMTYLNNYFNSSNDEVRPHYLLNNLTKRDIDIFAMQMDFTLPIAEKSKLEAGSKYSNVETMNNTLFQQKGEAGQWETLSNRSNTFLYTEEVIAGYLNGSTQLGPFMMQAGLRIEKTNSEGFSMTLNQRVPRSYTDLFPNLSLSHQVGDKHSLSYSYSRKLNRPNYEALNPFELYLDEYTFEKGNPFLNPQYSSNFGINYAFKNALFVSLDYSHTTDAITEVIEQNAVENKTFKTELNLDDFRNYSMSISAPRVWTEWFTSRLNYTTFYNQFNSAFSEGEIDNSGLSHVVYLGNELNLGNGFNAEVSGRYQSKMIYGVFQILPRWAVNFGLSKKVMDGKGMLKFNITDIFLGQNSLVIIDQGDIDFVLNQRNDTRRASLTFNYSFGNQKVKQARRRKTATDAETNRL